MTSPLDPSLRWNVPFLVCGGLLFAFGNEVRLMLSLESRVCVCFLKVELSLYNFIYLVLSAFLFTCELTVVGDICYYILLFSMLSITGFYDGRGYHKNVGL